MAHRVTIGDVARESNVSRQTVSRALNHKGEISDETRQHVLAVIERLGYRPSSIARGLATRRTLTIGLVVPDVANPFFAEVARGAEDAARTAGYALLLCNTGEDPQREAEVLRTLEDKRVDGVVLCSSRLPAEELVELAAAHSAVVLVNRNLPGSDMGSVRLDDQAGGQMAVEYLLSCGRRTIGFLSGPAVSQSAHERTAGYEAALAAAGLPVDRGLLVPCAPFQDAGRAAALNLLTARSDVDALFCYNDLVAVGALQACEALGRAVPDTVAVMGCDDIILAGLVTPPLTTLRVPKQELGAAAVRLLLEQIENRPAAEVVMPPELVIRRSA